MDSDRLLSIGAGIAQGLEKATQNLQNIQMAKYTIAQQQEMKKLEQRKYDADIKLTQAKITEAEMKNRQEKEFYENLDTRYGAYLQGLKTSELESTAGRIGTISNPQMGQPTSRQPMNKLEFLQSTLPAGTSKEFGGVTIKSKAEVDTQEKMLERASGLRKEFNASQTIKDFNTVNRGFQGLQSAYELATAPDAESRIASDQALGVLFQKLLDPQSVVRESEYARTPEGASFLNRIQSIAPQMAKGGLKLKDTDRTALLDMAKKLLISSGNIYNEHIDRYAQLAKDYNVNPELIFGGLKKFEIPQETQSNVGVDAELQAKIQKAKEAGYTDEEIQTYLNKGK